MKHVNEYREIIEQFARDRTDSRVSNGMQEHASILIETMFKNATAEMRIFSRDLDVAVFGSNAMLEAVSQFLSKPYAQLKILLQAAKDTDWADNHPLLQHIRNMSSAGLHGRVDVRNAVGSYKDDDANHFAVMDNDGFRFELDHNECKAVANFNEPKVAQNLLEVFDKVFESSVSSSEPVFQLKAAA